MSTIKIKGQSQLDAEVAILPSSAYEGTPEGKSAAKKHIKIEIRKDFHLKKTAFFIFSDEKNGLSFDCFRVFVLR